MIKLIRVAIPTLVSAFAMTGCGGGTAGSPGNLPISSVPSNASTQANAIVQTDALQRLAPSAGTIQAAKGPTVAKIYVADFNADTFGDLQTYTGTGTLVASTSSGFDGPQNIAVDGRGHVFMANFGEDQILSFTKTLHPYKAPIPVPDAPVGLALGPKGKLYVTLYSTGTVMTFDQNGTEVPPTIAGPGNITYVAVDAHGKIYVTNSASNTLNTYKPDGTPTTPTITAGLNGPGPVVVDSAGKIYVANNPSSGASSITTYNPDGTQTTPTIAVNEAHGVAVAKNGNIYVTDDTDKTVMTFKADGSPTTPTITGLSEPTGVAVLNR
jgi:streptogramin lyase